MVQVAITKTSGEILGLAVVESGWGSILPTVVVANLLHGGPAERCGELSIGDRIMSVNGTSLVGLPITTCQNIIRVRTEFLAQIVKLSNCTKNALDGTIFHVFFLLFFLIFTCADHIFIFHPIKHCLVVSRAHLHFLFFKDLKSQKYVKLSIVHCPPVTMAIIKRPDPKYQLGFSVEDGIVCWSSFYY